MNLAPSLTLHVILALAHIAIPLVADAQQPHTRQGAAPGVHSHGTDGLRVALDFLVERREIDGDYVTNREGLRFAGKESERFTPVQVSADGGAFVAFNEKVESLTFHPRLARLDRSGAVRWTTPLPVGPSYNTYEVKGVLLTDDDGAIVVVQPFRRNLPVPTQVHRVSADGRVLWTAQPTRVGVDGPFLSAGSVGMEGEVHLTGHYVGKRESIGTDQDLRLWSGTVDADGRLIGWTSPGPYIHTPPTAMDPLWYPIFRPWNFQYGTYEDLAGR